MKVSEAMHSPAQWHGAQTPVKEIAEAMARDDIGAVLIGKDDRLVGMVTDRDLALRVVAKGLDAAKTRAEDVMTPGILHCRSDDDLAEAIKMMNRKQVRRLPVLDADKRLVGMLSLGDVAHAARPQAAGELARAVAAHHG